MEPTKPNPDLPEPHGDHTASDLRDAAGLSYRQINDWDSKGALPGSREGEAGWRKFTPKDVFIIMVCAEIRRQFGVPVERLAYVRQFMEQEGAGHLEYCVHKMGQGFAVWLLTDLREAFVIDTDIEWGDLLDLGYFRRGDDDPEAYVFIRLNPIVNRLLACLKEPVKLETNPKIYDVVRAARAVPQARSTEEVQVLQLLRNRDFKRVVVQLADGEIIEASGDIEHASPGRPVGLDQIRQIISSRGYQTITMTLHDGRAVRVKQTIPKVVRGAKGRSTSKGRTPTSRN